MWIYEWLKMDSVAQHTTVKCFKVVWHFIYCKVCLTTFNNGVLQYIGHFIAKSFTTCWTWHCVAGWYDDRHPNNNQKSYSLIKLN